jgi:hypothetical protein
VSQASAAEGRDGRLSDEVKWSKFSTISWTKDSKGFFYQVYDTSYHPTCSFLTRTIQRYPARDLHAAKHGDRVTIRLERLNVGDAVTFWLARG